MKSQQDDTSLPETS